MTEATVARCQAVTEDGLPCTRQAEAESVFCAQHRAAELAAEAVLPAAGPVVAALGVGPASTAANDDGWLVVEDRAPAWRASPAAGPGEPDSADLGLTVDDRLTQRRMQDAQRQGRLQAELSRFAQAAQRLAGPGAETAPPTVAEAQSLLSRLLGPFFPQQLIEQGGVYLSPDLWKGAWYVATYLLRTQTGSVRRRLEGDYELDDFGRDQGLLNVILPLAGLLYRDYWRVEVNGVEHVPDEGGALLVSNHSGVLPFDGVMIGLALYNGTASRRLPRALVASWFPTLPFVSMLLQKTGQVQAHPLTAQRLLERNELVVVFPEGIKGVGKPFRERYQLQRFGRGGFIKVALQTGAPIIPVAVIGAEEIYPMIGQVAPLARLLGMPFFPLTPTWPWLGPLGLAPLPTKWFIDIGEPIRLDGYEARAAANPAVVARLSDQVRVTIQRMLLERLAKRRSIFFG